MVKVQELDADQLSAVAGGGLSGSAEFDPATGQMVYRDAFGNVVSPTPSSLPGGGIDPAPYRL